MGTVSTSTIANELKDTLETIVDDPSGKKNVKFGMWCEEGSQSDHWEDDIEMGGPGLAQQVAEGAEVPIGEIREGFIKRYIANKYALRLLVTEEALDDNKYPKAIRAAGRLNRALWKTADIDATSMLVRAWNSSYLGGDLQPLCSASHTLPHGGTFSNTLATPLTPSRSALIVAETQVGLYPGHDGVTEGWMLKRILCPLNQKQIWRGIVGSDKVPESDRNEINVVKDMDLEVVALQHWSNTTTNWIAQTDCPEGLQFRWRKRPSNRSWVDNPQMLVHYLISARWSKGWTDARSVLGSQA